MRCIDNTVPSISGLQVIQVHRFALVHVGFDPCIPGDVSRILRNRVSQILLTSSLLSCGPSLSSFPVVGHQGNVVLQRCPVHRIVVGMGIYTWSVLFHSRLGILSICRFSFLGIRTSPSLGL